MSGTISFNPFLTSQPQDSFLLQTQGYVSGTAFDDPSVRLELMGGVLASTETIVMWGGVPVTEQINVTGAGSEGTGPKVARATSQASTTGFSVFNQASSMVITPGQTVPVAAVGNYVSFFRTASNIRVAVNVDPALVAAISTGESIAVANLLWDPVNMRVGAGTPSGSQFALPTSVKLLSVNTNSKLVSYNSGTGAVTWTTGDAAMILI